MESYIVHIYRRGEGNNREIKGTVEDIKRGTSEPFADVDDLHRILSRGSCEERGKDETA